METEKFRERENSQKMRWWKQRSEHCWHPCKCVSLFTPAASVTCAETWRLFPVRTFSQIDFSILLPFRQCVDTRFLRNSSLHWTQIRTVPCHFVSVGLSAIAGTLPSISTVPVDPQWTQTTSATSGNLYGKGGRDIWPQGEQGLTHESMTISFRTPRVSWCSYSLLYLPFLVILSSAVVSSKILKLSSLGKRVSSYCSQLSVPDMTTLEFCKPQGSKMTSQSLVGNSFWEAANRRTVTLLVPLFRAFPCLLQQPHSHIERTGQ